MLDGRLGGERVVGVTFGGLSAPGERARDLPARRGFARVESARGEAFLVDAGFELLRILQMSPAALQGEVRRRVPRQAHRGRIERCDLDVPAVLVGLAAVEA